MLALPSLTELRGQEMELQRQEAMLRSKNGGPHREIIQLDAGRYPINIERGHLAETRGGEIRLPPEARERDRLRRAAGGRARAAPRADRERPDPRRSGGGAAARSATPGGGRSLPFVAFLNRFKEVSEQQDLLKSGAWWAPGPEFPESRVSKARLMTAAGFTVSLAFGTMLAFLVEYLDSGLRTGRQVERALGLPNLGLRPERQRLEVRSRSFTAI